MVSEVSNQKICPQCAEKFENNQMICPADGSLLISKHNKPCAPIMAKSLIGERVGPYEVLSMRKTGYKSFVFEVKHDSGMHQAMKMLRPELSRSKSSLERFQQEARVALAMDHPNSVKVYDFGVTSAGDPYLVMELLEGVTLDKLMLEKHRLDIDSFYSIFRQLCDVLSSAHKRGVIHRDLKPEHVMLLNQEGSDYTVKLLDFGCSKDLEREQKLTVAGLIIGNVDYMSPEQCSGGNIDARSDVYSLGCTMYYALTGKKPFEGNVVEVMQQHLSHQPPRMREAYPEISLPKPLEKAIAKAMHKDPHERQQTVEALWDEIECALDEDKCSSGNGKEAQPTQEGFLVGLVKHFKKER